MKNYNNKNNNVKYKIYLNNNKYLKIFKHYHKKL